jgi:hypothetical protein
VFGGVIAHTPTPKLAIGMAAAVVGVGHAAQEAPQVSGELSLTQSPVPAGQRWKFGLHSKPHALFAQTGTAFGSDDGAQVWQTPAVVPHAVVLSSGKHPFMPRQVWVPGPHMAPHMALAPQAEPGAQPPQSTPSLVPQVALAVLLTQTPPHRWKPALHL